MRRALVAVCVLALLAVGSPADARPQLPADWRLHPCGSPTRANPPAEVDRALRTSAAESGVSYALLRAIARGESAFNPRAANSQAGGIGQHLYRYWPGRVAAFNRAHPDNRVHPWILDLWGNVRVTAWMLSLGQASAWRC